MFKVDRKPINKLAAKSFFKGDKWIPDKKITQLHFINRPLTIPIPSEATQNLIGIKFGRLTVDGLYEKGKWLVRCECGAYETRRPKAIKNPKNNIDCCNFCRHKAYLKRDEFYRRNGYNRPGE